MLMNRFMQKLRALRFDTSGMAMVEFAYALPVLLGLGGAGIEAGNYIALNHKLSQAALALADNMSRVGASSSLSQQQIRESDVNDGFMGLRRQAGDISITERGRIVLSSLQQNVNGGQWIAWQRCVGKKSIGSAYGTQGTGATGTGFPGMGTPARRVTAPPGSAVMFVEIFYDYEGAFGTMFMAPQTVKYEASFVVRDDRDLTGGPTANGMYNPAPVATPSSCTAYGA